MAERGAAAQDGDGKLDAVELGEFYMSQVTTGCHLLTRDAVGCWGVSCCSPKL
jgi:hypothetical protein